MVKLLEIFRIAAVMTVVLALSASSCTKPDSKTELSLMVESEAVPAKACQIFVSIKCSSSWTVSLTDDADDSAVDWAVLNASEGNGDRNLILSLDANEDEASARKVRITVFSGPVMKQAVVEQAAAEKHEEVKPGPEPGKPAVPDLSKKEWMELPAMDNPDLGYYSHSFKMNGTTYRNYTFGWSQKDMVALWVAYPLSKLYINGNAGYTKAWAYDPHLGELSAAPFGGYGGPYDRGHQLPSADRQCCYEANAQTFYGTNMTPQSNAFNTGIWVNLEDKVRAITRTSDTTYVVTGCMVKEPKGYTTDSDGRKMTIPSAYFKALLKYSKSSTLGQWNAVAFYLDHDEPSGTVSKSHSMSIDELEEITGIDFFANLPAKVGESQAAKIEAADPAQSSIWW